MLWIVFVIFVKHKLFKKKSDQKIYEITYRYNYQYILNL